MLELFRSQQQIDGSLQDGLSDLYIGGWRPDAMNGNAGSSWMRNERSRDAQPVPDLCWDADGSVDPIGLVETDEEEREVCISSEIPLLDVAYMILTARSFSHRPLIPR